MKKWICAFVCCLMTLEGRDYSKELITAFFPEGFMNEVMLKNQVPKEQWESINKDLTAKNSEVIPRVDEKASKIAPDLLVDPKQKQVAVKLFRETLFELFSEVMVSHGVTDNGKIQEIFDQLKQLKAESHFQSMQNRRLAKADEINYPG